MLSNRDQSLLVAGMTLIWGDDNAAIKHGFDFGADDAV